MCPFHASVVREAASGEIGDVTFFQTSPPQQPAAILPFFGWLAAKQEGTEEKRQ